jgi:hypothetical protein
MRRCKLNGMGYLVVLLICTIAPSFLLVNFAIADSVAATSTRVYCYYGDMIHSACDSGAVAGDTATCGLTPGTHCEYEGDINCYSTDFCEQGAPFGPVGPAFAFNINWDTDSLDCTCKVGANGWSIGGEVASAACCSDDAGEYQTLCTDSSSNGDCGADALACCNANNKCVDDTGDCQVAGLCNDLGLKKSYCNLGTWEDPDEAQAYCVALGCGYDWSIGGEVASAACCSDDAGEYPTSCTDSSLNGDCGADALACCNANNKCVDDTGDCQVAGLCNDFGLMKSYCNSGTWEDPDETQAYCVALGCGYEWMASTSRCCGDDLSYEEDNDCYLDIGLKEYDGTGIVGIAVVSPDAEPTVSSKLKIYKGGITYSIALVDSGSPKASKIIVQTSAGKKALRKL